MNAYLMVPKAQLSAFCGANGIRWLAIFGSALREDFGPESDVDVLVEFDTRSCTRTIGSRGYGAGVVQVIQWTKGGPADTRGSEPVLQAGGAGRSGTAICTGMTRFG